MNVSSISSTDYQLYLQKLREEQKTQNQDVVSTTQQMPSFSKDMDSYIPSEQNDDSQMAIPSQQYNDMRPSMPPMAPPEEASETAASRVVVILGLAALRQATGCRGQRATAGGPTTELASFQGYLASSQHADSSKM